MPFPFGAIAGLAGTLLGNQSVARQNQMSQQFQIDRYNQRLSDTRSLRDEDRIYNSPEGQMSRLAAAGINPKSIFSGGAISDGGGATRPPNQGNEAQFRPSEFSGLAAAGTDFMHGILDIQLKKEQVRNAERRNAMLDVDIGIGKAVKRIKGVDAEIGETNKFTRIHKEQDQGRIVEAEAAVKGALAERTTELRQMEIDGKILNTLILESMQKMSGINQKQAAAQLQRTQEEINQIALSLKNLGKDGILSMLPELVKAIIIGLIK